MTRAPVYDQRALGYMFTAATVLADITRVLGELDLGGCAEFPEHWGAAQAAVVVREVNNVTCGTPDDAVLLDATTSMKVASGIVKRVLRVHQILDDVLPELGCLVRSMAPGDGGREIRASLV